MPLRHLFYLTAGFLSLAFTLPAAARVLDVRIADIPATGDIHVFVYTSPKDFPKEAAAAVHTRYPVTDREQKSLKVQIEVPDAPQYALVAYQDEDGNGKMNRFLGMIPQEPYGLSQNPRLFGKPRFSDAAITPVAGNAIIIHLKD